MTSPKREKSHLHKPGTSSSQATSGRPPWLLNACTEPSKLYTGLKCKTRSTSLLKIARQGLKFSNSNHKQPPSHKLGKEVPLLPWIMLSTDIFHLENCSYLTMVDYYPWFPVICKLDGMTGMHVTNHMQAVYFRVWMARHPSI